MEILEMRLPKAVEGGMVCKLQYSIATYKSHLSDVRHSP